MDSTRVLVLDKGTVVEFDMPKQLLANKKSFFYSMAQKARLVVNH
jgi:ATP-binding cassette subfamily C (CFTR/MRP) protein 1